MVLRLDEGISTALEFLPYLDEKGKTAKTHRSPVGKERCVAV